jgi:REP-associated tyrosine transposase
MPRRAREEAAGAIHHVVAEGNGKARIVVDDSDRVDLVRRLAAACAVHGWRCHAYCLLDTHLHSVLETADPNLGLGMRRLLGDYAQSFHRRHHSEGHLFRRPYYSRRVHDESHFVSACIYVVLNPVEAGMCAHPVEWVWCSYEQTAYDKPGFVHTETLLASFGVDVELSRQAYRAAVDHAATQTRAAMFDQPTSGVSPLTG